MASTLIALQMKNAKIMPEESPMTGMIVIPKKNL